jgi:putative membrane protein
MLVTDHTRSDGNVTRTASDLGIDLPTTVAPEDAAAAARLANESGVRFDDDFLATMITGHQKAIALTRAEIARGSSPAVTGLARKTFPVLTKHLTTLRKARGG